MYLIEKVKVKTVCVYTAGPRNKMQINLKVSAWLISLFSQIQNDWQEPQQHT